MMQIEEHEMKIKSVNDKKSKNEFSLEVDVLRTVVIADDTRTVKVIIKGDPDTNDIIKAIDPLTDLGRKAYLSLNLDSNKQSRVTDFTSPSGSFVVESSDDDDEVYFDDDEQEDED